MRTIELQRALNELGYDPGPLDGVLGPRTRAALRAYQASAGLMVDGVPGPQTWASLREKLALAHQDEVDTPPWVEEMLRRKGLHENRDHKALQAWLRSAGSAVDPAVVPWCGDAVETAILRTLPDVQVPNNPMASINWLKFGQELAEPVCGAILVFWRGRPDSWEGHVGFYVGESDPYYHVLGGNQSNEISITRMSKDRLRKGGIRWPSRYPVFGHRFVVDESDLLVTHNER